MLKDLRTSLYNVGKTVSGSNGFYYSQAAQNANFPYITYHLITDDLSRESTDTEEDAIFIQFNVIDRRKLKAGRLNTSIAIENAAEELISKIEAGISVTGYKTSDFKRIYTTPAEIIEDYWELKIRYELNLIK